jgi:hypothetical protein
MKITWSLASCVAFALLAVASAQSQVVMGRGTPSTIPVWTSSGRIGNSIISQSGGDTVRINGVVRAAFSGDRPAVQGSGGTSTGVEGDSTSGMGVVGTSGTSVGVEGDSAIGIGVRGTSSTSIGVYGNSESGVGVYGNSSTTDGVKGISGTKGGVVGESTTGDGVAGVACNSDCGGAGVFGAGKLAGGFNGNVGISGDLSVTGLKAFHMDHPLDPANKYLNHFSIESNEVLDTYSGNITTDASGTAKVELPEYFEALNKNYRYQLTVIGQFAQAIIWQKIERNSFVIKTDKPDVEVSWQVTGVRSDAYVKAHPMAVEEDKPAQERGHYLTPEVFGQPEEMSMAWLYHGELMREAKELEQRRRAQGAVKAPPGISERQIAANVH